MIIVKFFSLILSFRLVVIQSLVIEECSNVIDNINENTLATLTKAVVPELEGKKKGDAGKIAIVGGSIEYTGAPYFAAISALKVGADLVFVITTETAATVIKSYSPDLIVIPHLSKNISSLLYSKDVVVLGPGLGRAEEGLGLAYDTINICKELRKPLVIDADGLYAIYKNVSILKNYPYPGVILTPNSAEVKRLKEVIPVEGANRYEFWGDYVTVLEKGEQDQYHSNLGKFDWSLNEGGSGRRAGGQGDILAGSLGTFFNWALKANLCENDQSVSLAQSVASYAAAKFTRTCNYKAFKSHGRSMVASDMLNEIHSTFEDLFT
ncbi:ATP-dependent (S)-NAD(P)H-hydrate dehydratase-like [Nymphalis io]|uniref:ATP-dependent (S)-NAD(P)H-hydrate dehydratase-like n=1 Tax=Inachis io TaxID=171585 RepID=UPI002169288A|nr:ATP-dependent (S)-NAD(P)H-hydrate dehydratase-like [Nymphalis io]